MLTVLAGSWSIAEIDAVVKAYEVAYVPVAQASSELASLGVRVYQPSAKLTWSDLAGCEAIAKEITTTVIDSTLHADLFDDIMKMTRARPESNRPRAVLFEGKLGCSLGRVAQSSPGCYRSSWDWEDNRRENHCKSGFFAARVRAASVDHVDGRCAVSVDVTLRLMPVM